MTPVLAHSQKYLGQVKVIVRLCLKKGSKLIKNAEGLENALMEQSGTPLAMKNGIIHFSKIEFIKDVEHFMA